MGGFSSSGTATKPGTVAFFAAAAAPSGWLNANGAAVSRTSYAVLFAVVGTTYGAGDGSTTFNLPDLRGEFIRGFDDGRGVDAGRAIGSAQAGQNASHTHALNGGGSSYGVVNNPSGWISGGGGGGGPYDVSATQSTAATGGTESRPRNIAMLACIKY